MLKGECCTADAYSLKGVQNGEVFPAKKQTINWQSHILWTEHAE